MLKLRRLRIERFQGMAPGTELRFSDGINEPMRSDYVFAHTALDFLTKLKELMGFASAELSYVPITSPEQVQHSFVLCRSERRAGRPGWIWENMSDEDATELFAAYEVGIEHVSEILQSRG